jgi:hypothetical protein
MVAEREAVPIGRTKDGQTVTEWLEIEFAPATAGGPPMVLIASGWSQRSARFRNVDLYEILPGGEHLDGRAYQLNRADDAIRADRDHAEIYGVFVGPVPAADVCTCRGFLGCRGRGLPCKHTAALRHLVETRRI